MKSYFHKLIKRPYLFYSLLFAIISLVVFGPNLIGGGTLIWNGDGISQHYPALVQVHKDFQQLLFHGKSIPLWQWNVGLGQDYFQTFSYYVLGDPFFYPSILFPESFLTDYYSIMVIVRLYLAGISFIYTAKRLVSSQSFSRSLGALVYVFSGYTAYSTFSHPFFLNPLIIFPLLILSIHYAFEKNSILPFIAMVSVTLISNFYFAYILAVGAVIYWLIEIICHQKYRNWKNLVRFVSGAVTGFLIGACLFIPSTYFVINSARTGEKIANGLKFYPFSYYISIPGTMLVPRVTSEFWLRGGLMSLGLLGVVFIWRRYKEYRTLSIIYSVTIICLLFPIFAGILNGMSSPSNRWLLLFQLPLGISSVILLDRYRDVNRKDFRAFIIFGGVICISLLLTSDFGHYQGDLGMLVFQYLFAVMVLLLFKKYSFKIKGIMTVLTLFNAATIFLTVQPYSLNPTNKLLSKTAVLNLVERQRNYPQETMPNYGKNLEIDNRDQPTFKRSFIDSQFPKYVYSPSLPILSPLHSFETYWSLENNDVYQFMHSLGVSNSIRNDVTGNADFRNILLNYLGVSEIWLNEGSTIIPDSYKGIEPDLYNNQKVYQSDSSFPLFYFPTYLISPKTFDKMTTTQKEASLLDSVSVDKGTQKSEMAKKVQNVPFYNQTILYQDGQHLNFDTQTPEQLKLQSPSGQVILMLPANRDLKNKELHLEFSNIDYQTFNFTELWHADFADYQAEHNNNDLKGLDDLQNYDPDAYKYRWLMRNYLKFARTKPGYEMSVSYLDRTNSYKQQSPKRLSGYEYRNNVTLNLGTADKFNKEQWIILNTDTLAHFSFDLKLVSVPTGSEITKAAKKIRHESKENLNFKIGHDQIDLNIKKPVQKVVATTIPYSEGWRINHGKIVKVNKGFIGIELENGQKSYRLRYRTPLLDLSILMSVIGIIFTIAIAFYEWRSLKP